MLPTTETRYRILSLAATWSLLFLAAIASPVALGQIHIDTIALTGWEASGFEPAATFSSRIDGNWNSGFFEHRAPYLNNAGEVLFGAQAYDYPLGDRYDDGLWASDGDGNLRLIRRERMAAPGTNSDFGECGGFDQDGSCTGQHPDDGMEILGLSDAGEGVFLSKLVGPNVYLSSPNHVANWEGIWSERGAGGLHLVARMGDPAPGTAELFGRIEVSSFSVPKPTNDDGLVTFMAEIGSDRNNKGLWAEESSGALRLIVKTGDAAPGTTSQFVEFGQTHIDGQGDIAFWGRIETPNGVQSNGLWRGSTTGVTPLVILGDSVPEVTGKTFYSLSPRGIAESGQLVFRGSWRLDPGGPNFWGDGLFVTSENGIRNVALSGDLISASPELSISGFGSAAIDDQGRVAFMSELSQENNPGQPSVHALLAERNGSLAWITDSNRLPGLAADEVLLQFGKLAANASGQLAFSAIFNVPCENPDDPFQCGNNEQGSGFWLVGDDDQAELVIRTGDSLEVSPGDWREIYSLRSSDGLDLNDQGQFTFMAQFLDGTQGVFRAQGVPEPSSFAIFAMGLLGTVAYTRRLYRRNAQQ